MVICLEQGADLHMAQLMPLPLTVSCFIKIQIDITFLVLAYLLRPGKRAVIRVRVRARVCVCVAFKTEVMVWCHDLPHGTEKLEACYFVILHSKQ